MKRRLIAQFDSMGNGTLTLVLLALAAVLVLLALFGHPLVKAAAVVWVVLP